MIYFYYYSYYLQLPPLALESGFFPATLCSPAALFRPWSLTVFSFLWLGLVQSRMHLGPYLHHNPQDVQIVAIKDVHQLPYVFAMKKKTKNKKHTKKKKQTTSEHIQMCMLVYVCILDASFPFSLFPVSENQPWLILLPTCPPHTAPSVKSLC